ncbi:hypothetical protein ACHAWU_003904 [Discostella pseudostelligera]|uniref:Uncharacterized protein n=1 Tax=Discostella pseudostelligera TaxID=259834 RepID=A0ABD3MPF9_9STRA
MVDFGFNQLCMKVETEVSINSSAFSETDIVTSRCNASTMSPITSLSISAEKYSLHTTFGSTMNTWILSTSDSILVMKDNVDFAVVQCILHSLIKS